MGFIIFNHHRFWLWFIFYLRNIFFCQDFLQCLPNYTDLLFLQYSNSFSMYLFCFWKEIKALTYHSSPWNCCGWIMLGCIFRYTIVPFSDFLLVLNERQKAYQPSGFYKALNMCLKYNRSSVKYTYHYYIVQNVRNLTFAHISISTLKAVMAFLPQIIDNNNIHSSWWLRITSQG